MKQLKTEIIIYAPAHVIWKFLTDFNEYPNWNPFITSIVGDIKEGEVFKVTIQPPGSSPMTFKPVCLQYSKNKSLRWLGHLFFPGLFDGEHIFELRVQEDGSTLFIQRENFKGILVPLLWKQISTNTRKGFEMMNHKLKELAENQISPDK